jgi:septal ring factor EnvC (AmiA/AmiB activator)
MKQKIEQGSRQREAERKRYLEELQELKKERRQIEKIMQEKEKTISRLEARIREQHYRIEKLSEENEMLLAKTAEGWSIKKFWERIALHKKPSR